MGAHCTLMHVLIERQSLCLRSYKNELLIHKEILEGRLQCFIRPHYASEGLTAYSPSWLFGSRIR